MKRLLLAAALLSAIGAGGCLQIKEPLGKVEVKDGKNYEQRLRALEQQVNDLDARVRTLEAARR